MSRTILVPLDGSAFSAQVIPCAVSAARALGAVIEFVQVHVPAYPKAWLDDAPETDLRWEIERKQEELKHLSGIAERVEKESSIPTRSVLLQGEVVRALLKHVKDRSISLIVMATHGRGGVSFTWLGSVADRVVHETKIPVLLFHPRPNAAWSPSANPFEHILVPLDGSPLAESVLPFALTLGTASAKYTLMRVLPSLDTLSLSPRVRALLQHSGNSEADQRAVDYMENVAGSLAARAYRAETFVRTHPQPAVAILEHAYECGADIIALSTHGRRGLPRATLGSVADKLLRGFQKPVLLYRPPAPVSTPRRELATTGVA